MNSPVIANSLRGALLVLAVLSFLHAQLQFSRIVRANTTKRFEELHLTKTEAIRAGFLNYSTFAADLSWVALVVNYGMGKRHWARYSNLEHNATVVRDLDPRFRRLYDWFPGVYLVFRWPQRHEDAEVTLRFARRGFDAFPNDGALPFHAAMSFVGVKPPPEGLSATYGRVVELAELAVERGDPDAGGVIPFFRSKLRGENVDDVEGEVNFLTTMLARARNPAERRQFEEQLAALAKRDEGARAMLEKARAFDLRHAAERPFVSQELQALIRHD